MGDDLRDGLRAALLLLILAADLAIAVGAFLIVKWTGDWPLPGDLFVAPVVAELVGFSAGLSSKAVSQRVDRLMTDLAGWGLVASALLLLPWIAEALARLLGGFNAS